MKYLCESCKKTFLHPAKLIERKETPSHYYVDEIESSVCPFCIGKELAEWIEPQEDIANVYIYELTTGPQTELDGLLAQGYRIVNRYSKQYHLEKPKAKLEEVMP